MSKLIADSGTTQTAWNQLDQLLNCAICLDRYRNPKLLPCQHTFCMEPCLEGLIDYIRRQIKCPECRAEHRIPYQGIQGYPTNVTLMRFLELHFEVTGETPDPTPSVRERCGVCSEKAYLATCYHCDKKVCPDCKEAHLDILRREIARINNQIRRGLHRLQDAVSQSEKSVHLLQQNCCNVTQEIEEVYARLQKELKEREEILKNEVQMFLQSELRNLTQLKDNLDIEVANIQSNCELAEKHVNENSEWEDVELVDYKDTFLKTLEFVRNFDSEQAEFNGRLKFQGGPESDAVHTSIANFGELILNCPQYPTNTPNAAITSNLMRSKSDHRLATQFHRQEESRNYLGIGQRFSATDSESKLEGRATSPLSRRRTGDTDYRRNITDRARDLDEGERFGSRRYGREFGGNWQREDTDTGGYRSRFARDDLREGSDPDAHSSRGVRFAKHEQQEAAPRERIFESEDASKGPLSGITRLMDCPTVIRKLQLHEQHQKQKLEEKSQPPPPTPAPVVQQTVQPVRRTQRQVSEDDEIAKIKAQNKNQTSTQTSTNTTSTMTATTASEPPSRPLARRVAALQNKEEVSRPTVQLNRSSSRDERSDTSDTPSSPTQLGRRRTGSRQDESSSEPTTPKSLTKQTSRDTSTSRDSTPSRPPSRQVSRDGEYKTPPSTPTRKLSTDQRSDTSNDESSVAAKRRFFTRNQSDSRFERPNLKTAAPTPIAETPKTSSESDSDRMTSAESTPVHSANVVEEVKGQDTPNYFRFRNSNHSRTPSNSSVDDSAKSPSSPGSPLFARGRPETTRPPEEKKEERAKSTDSTSSTETSSSESSESSSPSRTTPVKTPVPEREDKTEDATKSRFSTPRQSAAPAKYNEAPKSDGRNSPSTNRSSTPFSSRTSSIEKQDDTKDTTKSKFVSRFLPRQSTTVADNKGDESSSETESESEQAAKEAARDASITALLARSALARRESTGSVLSVPSGSRFDSTSSTTRSGLYSRDRDDSTSNLGLRKPSSYLHSRDDKRDTDGAESRYSSLTSKYGNRGRSTLDDDKDKYGSYASRYLARSKSSAALSLDRDDSPDDSSRRIGSDRFRKESRFSALRRNPSRLGRSRSSHDIALHGDDDDDRDVGTTSYRSSRTRDLYGTSGSSTSSPSTSSTTSSYRPWSSSYKPSYYSSRY